MSASPPRVDPRFAVSCAALLTAVFALQLWIAPPVDRPDLDLFTAFLLQGIRFGMWLPLLPLILRGARKRPLMGRPGSRWMLRTSGLGALFALSHGVLAGIVRWATGLSTSRDLGVVMLNGAVVGFGASFLAYWVIVIAYQAVLYHAAIREQDKRSAALELDLTRATLTSVEATLRPHFLFNTLNAIAALMRDNPRAAETMLGQLSDLLRASLSGDPSSEVPLSDELALAEQYLAIERVRFEDRLTVVVNVSTEAQCALVPRLILQPVVENAVRHGIAPLEDGGAIVVNASKEGSRLHITVTDDGVGIERAAATAGSGIGLNAIRTRLAHLYGTDYRLDLQPRSPRGTIVTIAIPFHGVRQ